MEAFLRDLSTSCSLGTVAGRACLAKVRKTAVSMLEARGFGAVAGRESELSELSELMLAGRPALRGSDSARGREDVLVFFCVEGKVGINPLRALMAAYEEEGAELCVVSIDGPTSFTRRDVGEQVQFMTYRQLFNDISKHSMVPPHALVPAERARELAGLFCVASDAHWPKLLAKDPVAQFHGFRRGDLVEIRRTGVGTNGGALYYRIVV